jgi:hypothetical protein
MIENPYYAELKQQIFSTPVNTATRYARRGAPRATFHFNRALDPGERFVLYDFVADIYGIFGQRLSVVSIVDGCIMLTLRFDKTCDAAGIDFRKAIESNRDYHELFIEYAVKDIYFQGFPKSPNTNQYRIARSGVPEPV